jgi:hypothetical protein
MDTHSKKAVLDALTGELTLEDLTEQEIADKEILLGYDNTATAEAESKAAAKAALLEKLGITADEAALLLA